MTDIYASIVGLEPVNAIQFSVKPDGKLEDVSYLNIKNNDGTQNLAFKVKTTAPKNYQVKPFQGVILPGQQARVEITIVPGPVSQFGLKVRFWSS